MKQLHLISGLPRSGSTLLCQLLNMNPKYHSTPTSYLGDMLRNMRSTFSNNFTAKTHDRLHEYEYFRRGLNGFIDGFYSDNNIVFDKNRSWPRDISILDSILGHSDSKIIWTYRNPVDIFNSIERRHQQTILMESLDESNGIESGTLDSRVNLLLDDNSIVGKPVLWLDDAIKRGYASRIFILKYDDLINDTVNTLQEIDKFTGNKLFDYKVEDMKQTTWEFDGLYNYKFMHKVRPGQVNTKEGINLLTQDHIQAINERFEWINNIANPTPIIGNI